MVTADLLLHVGWDAAPGWHDLLITTAAGDTVRVPHLLKVEGEPLPNHAPVADAGEDQQTWRQTIVTLDATASTDADYDRLTYEWRQTAGPSVTVLPSDTAPVVTFDTGDFVGDYRFELVVSDPFLSTGDSVTVTVVNRAPLADAGENQTGWRSDVFTLDGRGSSDPDGDGLAARWVQLLGPAVALLPSDTATLVSFIPDPAWVGDYSFRLEISDPWTTSSDTVTVTVTNHPPFADAGPEQRVTPHTWVTLDGSYSFDLDGDSLDYLWQQDGGPAVTLDLTDPVRPLFYIIEPGNYHFTLTCSDPFEASPADGVTVIINLPPSADAGLNQTGYRAAEVTLDGSLSFDPNWDPVTFEWEQLAGPAVTLAPGATAAVVGFTADPVFLGNYLFRLTVSDGYLSDSDTVSVITINRRPEPRAGQDQAGLRSQVFLLDGDSSSDPDGDPLAFQWLQTAGPGVTLLPSDTATAVMFSPAPDWVGRYVFELRAADPWDYAGDTVAVTVDNQPPTAQAGIEVLAILGDTVTLDGDSSSDPDGDPLEYLWLQLSGPTVTLDCSDPARPTFVAPATGNYLFELVVDDSFDLSDADTVAVVIVTRWNHVPVADAGPDQVLDWVDFSPVQLNGAGSHDPDDDPLTYRWEMVRKPPLSAAALSDPSSPTPSFHDDYLGTYDLRLTVFDGEVWSRPDEMTVVTEGNTIDSDGDGNPDCLDPDDDNDTLPDVWEALNGLDPLSNLDADPDQLDPVNDPDGDGNGNLHEYYNQSDPQAPDRADCTSRLGGCFFGDSDGDFFYGPGDLSAYRGRIKGAKTFFPMVYPHNGDNFDLDGDGFIAPGDVSRIAGVIKGGALIAEGLPSEAVLVSSGYTVAVESGATLGLSFRVKGGSGQPRSGLAVVFELVTGAGRFLGGEGPLSGSRTFNEAENLNSSANESAFSLSRDELEIIVASDRPGGQGGFDLFYSRRSAPELSFPPLSPLGEVNSFRHESMPALSADRLELFFARYNGSWDLFRSTRNDLNSVWSIPQPVTELNTSGVESAPSITDDGLTLYFVRFINPNGYEIFRAQRLTTSSAFMTATAVTELNTSSTENLPGISGDDTRIYFMSNRAAQATDYNIWYAERPSPAVPFSTPVPLSRVNSPLGDFQAWESPDRKRLYFTTFGYHSTSDVNLYLVQRPGVSLPFWAGFKTARYDVTGVMAGATALDSGGRARMVFEPEGCGTFEVAVHSPQDPIRKVPSFSAAQLVRVSVACP